MSNSVIYRRTEAGSNALRDADADMPRLVRQLLLLINGKNTANTYAEGLTGYGNVYTTLAELEVAGYIERIEAPAKAIESPAELRKKRKEGKSSKDSGKSEFDAKDTSWTTIFTSRFSARGTANTADTTFESTMRVGEPVDFEPTQGAEDTKQEADEQGAIGGFEVFDINKSLKQQSQAAMGIAAAARAPAPASRLEQVVAEISHFLMNNIGAESQEMVQLISAFRTEEELYAFLPRYEAGLMRRGLAADAHFDRIEWILKS
jgi:hypothetical protein